MFGADEPSGAVSPRGRRVASRRVVVDSRSDDGSFSNRRINASPDGRYLAVADAAMGAVRIVGGGREPVVVPGVRERPMRFSPDGAQYGYAGETSLTVVAGAATYRYAAGERVYGFRFAQRDAAAVIVTGPRVVRWDPVSGESRTLVTLPDGQIALAADVYDGGVAVWTSRLLDVDGT